MNEDFFFKLRDKVYQQFQKLNFLSILVQAPYQLALPTSMPMPGKHVEKTVEKAGAVFIQLEISSELGNKILNSR